MKCYMAECIHHNKFECKCSLNEDEIYIDYGEDEIYIDYGYGSRTLPCCMKFQTNGIRSERDSK